MVLTGSTKRTNQVSLITCPSEIISQIVGNLDKYSLSRLALSSRSLNVITTPYLYNHIKLLGGSQNRSRPESIDFRSLTLLLLERPHLAGYVRHFTMRNDFTSEDRGEPTEIAHLPQTLLTVIQAASYSKEEERQWLKDVNSTKTINKDALMALLLPTLPNLKTLHLTLGEDIMYFSRMMQRASRKEKPFDTTPAFEKLSDIVYVQNKRSTMFDDDHGDHDHEHPCYTVMPLPLPAVTRIFGLRSGFQIGITNQEPWVLPLACGFSSQLSHLELRDSLLSSQTLANLLQIPTALKTFIYEVNPKTTNSSFLNNNTYTALGHQMSSLEYIGLDCVPWGELVEFRQFRYVKPMPSFANFNNLRTLRIASPFLLGLFGVQEGDHRTYHHRLAPLLPEGLQTLHITRCEHFVFFIIEELEFLLERITNTTHLRKITIETPISWRRVIPPNITSLTGLAKDKNISFSALYSGVEHRANDFYDRRELS